MIKEGSKALDFKLRGVDGKVHSLKEAKSRYTVLYFYPKDLTPGCTIQAARYSACAGTLKRLGATVLGVSKDNINSHKRFKTKCKLKFMLLSDPTSKVIRGYGAYGNRGVFGMGTLRNTYIIKGGRVVKIFRKVDPLRDTANVIDYIKGN